MSEVSLSLGRSLAVSGVRPAEACGILMTLGRRYIAAGFFSIFEIASLFLMQYIFALLSGRPTIIWLIGLAFYLITGLVIVVYTFYRTKVLKGVTGDSYFERGAKLVLAGWLIFYLSYMFLFPVAYFFPITGGLLFRAGVFIGRFVIFEIGVIFLGIAFWRFGSLNDDDFMRIGAVLLFIIGFFLGLFLIGHSLKSLGSGCYRLVHSKNVRELLKEKLNKELAPGVPIDLRQLAKSGGVAPFVLIRQVEGMIKSGELKGSMMGEYTFIREE